MKFLIDAHLPKTLCLHFRRLGHEAIHTSFLPDGNATADERIAVWSLAADFVVVSKDIDFYHSHLLHGKPPKLVMVKLGNMRLAGLRTFFEVNAPIIAGLLENHDLLEVFRDKIVAID